MNKYIVVKKIGSGTYGSAYLIQLKANRDVQVCTGAHGATLSPWLRFHWIELPLLRLLGRRQHGARASRGLAALRSLPSVSQYVLKMIRVDNISPKERAAAHQETKLLQQLDHPFVLR